MIVWNIQANYKSIKLNSFPNQFIDAEPHLEHDSVVGCTVKNLNTFSLVSNSSKESYKHLHSTTNNIYVDSLQRSSVVIEFRMLRVKILFFDSVAIFKRAIQLSTISFTFNFLIDSYLFISISIQTLERFTQYGCKLLLLAWLIEYDGIFLCYFLDSTVSFSSC